MADLTVTAANVRPLGKCVIRRMKAGETITPGQPVYMSAADTASLTDGSAVATAACVGIAISNSDGATSFVAGENIDVVTSGIVTGFATNLTFGIYVYVDDDAGILATTAGTKSTIVGVGLNTTDLLVRVTPVGLA